jgi:hypothetical protein
VVVGLLRPTAGTVVLHGRHLLPNYVPLRYR